MYSATTPVLVSRLYRLPACLLLILIDNATSTPARCLHFSVSDISRVLGHLVLVSQIFSVENAK